MDVMFKVLRQTSGPEHFAILEKAALDDEFHSKQQLLGDRGVLPIWYPTGRHDLIASLLRWLVILQSSGPAGADFTVLEIEMGDVGQKWRLRIPSGVMNMSYSGNGEGARIRTTPKLGRL